MKRDDIAAGCLIAYALLLWVGNNKWNGFVIPPLPHDRGIGVVDGRIEGNRHALTVKQQIVIKHDCGHHP